MVPDVDQPEPIAFELPEGRYDQAVRVSGDRPYQATLPFPVEIVPGA